METIRICSVCRDPLPASAAEGLCPKCLLQQALATQTDLSSPAATPNPSLEAGTSRSPRIGKEFGPYHILRLLGRGGMGEVYEADHLETGRRVALKVVSRSLASPEEHARFMREGRLAASISHPNTVYIYGSEEIEGSPVIAMELVGGGTLKDQVKAEGPLPIRAAVDSILQIIEGLEAAQAAGILHRDIKPANCFVAGDGSVKVGDFGLSISTLARGETFLTAPGSILGTPAFASPEQLRGEELDVASDLYSVGATLYFLLTGRAPLEASDLVRLITEVLDRRPEAPETYRPQIPAGLSRVLLRTLEKARGKRFANYRQLREALLPFSSAAPTAATVGLRFIAGVVDYLLAALPEWACIIITGADSVTTLGATRSFGALAMLTASLLWTVLYFGLSESLWGAALGKGLCRLRVVGPDGHSPTLLRSLSRAAIFIFIPLLPYVLQALAQSTTQLQSALLSGESGWADVISVTLLLLMFVTARRRNGFAGLHELATQTRVLQRPLSAPIAHGAKPKLTPAMSPSPAGVIPRPRLALGLTSDPAPAPDEMRSAPSNLGPYQVLNLITRLGSSKLWLGYDPVLRRDVWLQTVEAGTAPVGAERRNISRAGRLRWLTGRRVTGENWDAYEAPSGGPLLGYPAQPWHILRSWLRDLAAEFYAGVRTQSSPSHAGVEQVWITGEGRAVLLDFAMPSSAPRPELPPTVRTPARYPIVPGHETTTLQAFLADVTTAGLDPALPTPLHAAPFLQRLRAGKFPAAELLIGNLESLLSRSSVVSSHRRLATLVAGPLLLAAVVAFGMAYDYAAQKRWDQFWTQSYPSRPSFRIALQTYEALKEAEGTSKNLEPLSDLYEVYLSSHFGDIIADPHFWQIPAVGSVFKTRSRQRAERAAARFPRPDPDRLQAAENLVAPSLRQSEVVDYAWYGLAAYFQLLAVSGILSLLLSLCLPFHPIMKLFGLAVVRRDGVPAGRLRSCGRSLVGWLPILIAGAFLAEAHLSHFNASPRAGNGDLYHPDALFMAGLVIAALGIASGIVLAWISPARGVQDYAAGTFLVTK